MDIYFKGSDNEKLALLLGQSIIVHKPHLCFLDFQLAFLCLAIKYEWTVNIQAQDT